MGLELGVGIKSCEEVDKDKDKEREGERKKA